MANEATLIVETDLPIMFTCANATGIEKGTLLKLSDPNTVAAATADNDIFIGIAAEEKIASEKKIPEAVKAKTLENQAPARKFGKKTKIRNQSTSF